MGSGISWTFGLAKQSDLDKVANNVRQIAYGMNVALNSWHKLSDDMRSYTVLNDARVSNLLQAVNDTRSMTTVLATQILTTRSEVSVMQPLIKFLSLLN